MNKTDTVTDTAAKETDAQGRPILLDIRSLRTTFHTDDGPVRAVDGVSLKIHRQETLGVVGESGCGKSITAMSVMRLFPSPPGRIEGGEILFHASGAESGPVDLAKVDPKGRVIRRIRGNEIAMIFQEPMTSLSPVHTVGNQISETIRLHQKVDKKEARERSIEMLRKVRLPKPERQFDAYPFELSGGMRQRAMIAMALSCNPSLLIADEPTTALDVTVQAEILYLIKELQEEIGMAVMLITHDLGVIAHMADTVAVMYMGKVVERASTRNVLKDPRHPYTVGLLRSIPRLGAKRALVPIKGTVPDPFKLPPGCSFGPRCPRQVYPGWDTDPPLLEEVAPGHFTRCCGTVCEEADEQPETAAP
ncbi:MAG: ABC transporter ATP-binding protein [Opitutales bacterium]|nr:ABC transporter ATP-binding protein [Opitutales bacterium]